MTWFFTEHMTGYDIFLVSMKMWDICKILQYTFSKIRFILSRMLVNIKIYLHNVIYIFAARLLQNKFIIYIGIIGWHEWYYPNQRLHQF